MTEIERNELTQNAMGGTELMATWLKERLDPELEKQFQIICSRVREIDENRIPVLWLHDLPNDPESHHLAMPENHEKFARFVFVSNWQMNEYINTYNLPWEKCVVIKNAIEGMEFKAKPDDGIVRLIYHSTPHRGLQILVPVFEHLQQYYPNMELDVYSSFKLYGWEQRDEPYKELFAQMDANPKINNHGTVSNEEIRKAVQKADIFAYPNIWPETSCLCAIEALMAGCLFVHPNYCALPETAADWGINYQWRPQGNDHANLFATVLENMLSTVATDKSVVHNMQHQQSIYYQNNYTWERRLPEWEQMLNHVLFEKNNGSE